MSEVLRPLPSRRAVLAGVLGAGVLLSGCRPFSDDDPSALPGTATPGTVSADPDADRALVDDVVADLSATHELVRRTVRRHPQLADDLEPLVALHARHVADLEGRVQTDGRRPAIAAGRSRARAEVLAGERQLRTALDAACVRAASGVLAATLGSMSAAVAQRLAQVGADL